ncbi:MAG: hypothetical protein E7415_05655 [Ruminococcaceae bacterium]|nr:hypothetical protein [Oscillospiraceae bacterium]
MTLEILLCLVVVFTTLENVFQKMYNFNTNSQKMGFFGFNFIILLASLISFLFMPKSENPIPLDIYVYAGAFAVTYLSARFCTILAMGEGALSLTSLVVSYSLLIPTLYGVFFQHDNLDTFNIIGLILLLISLYLVGSAKNTGVVTKKWFFYIIIAFIGNGLCATIQKMYQLKSSGDFKSEFMIIALAIIAVVSMLLTLFKEKKLSVPKLKNGGYLAIGIGIANALMNFFAMMLAKYPAAIVFPTIQGGGMVLIYIVSKFCFKEKLNWNQNVGFCIGVLSLIFLNM